MLAGMATTQTYDVERQNEATGTGALGGLASGVATGAAIGGAAGGAGAVPGAIIGGILGAVLGGVTGGATDASAQNAEIKASQAKAREEQDAALDAASISRAQKSATSSAYDLIDSGTTSPYSGGSAYDTWHSSKWG